MRRLFPMLLHVLNMPAPAAGEDLSKLIDEALAGAPARPTARTREWFRVRAAATDAPPTGGAPAPEAGTIVDIDIYSEIGSWFDGLTARDFIDALSGVPKDTQTIRVHVNSMGGEVFDALAIANALLRHPAKVEMHIEGIAASAATIVTQGAGDVIKIAENALVMIHDPLSFASGTAKDFRASAEALDRVKAAIVATYMRRSSLGADKLGEMMDASTWMNAAEALANGFATEVASSAAPVAASISPRMLAAIQVPEKYKPAFEAVARPTNDLKIKSGAGGTSLEEFSQAVWGALRELLGDPWAPGATCWWIAQTYEDAVVVSRDGQTWEYPITTSGDGDEITLGQAFEVEMVWVPASDGKAAALTTKARAKTDAKVIAWRPSAAPAPPPPVAADAREVLRLVAAAGLDLAFANSLITANVTAGDVPARIALAADVRALCVKAKVPELADGYISAGVPVATVKAHLVAVTARMDKAAIDAGLSPEDESPRRREPVIDTVAVYADRNKPRA